MAICMVWVDKEHCILLKPLPTYYKLISFNGHGALVEAGRRITASQFKIDENLITPITLNEYLDNMEEE